MNSGAYKLLCRLGIRTIRVPTRLTFSLSRVQAPVNCQQQKALKAQLHVSKNILINCLIALRHDWMLRMPVKIYCNQWESDDQRGLNSLHE